jgi:diguanylate cyclase (GGDEF)-like protein
MLLDLDRFKVINDTFGHLVGDRVLIEVARALVACVRSQDTLARQGGDEFSILAPETGEDHAEGLAARARDSLEAATNGSLSTSVGWATFPADGEDAATLLAVADVALRDAKRDRGAQQRQHAGTLSLAE